ncbi:EAL domain-containing protein [Noviherbaspirillum agri]
MTVSNTTDSAYTAPSRAHEFFLGRQPILDRNQTIVAYELLFRNAPVGPANVTDDLAATATVIAHASELGMEKVLGDSLGYLNVDAAVLASDIFQLLPREKIVLEILETTKVTPQVLQRVTELVNAGFKFALDDVITENADFRQLLPLAEVIKLDLREMSLPALRALTPKIKQAGKKLLAEKVETMEQFNLCMDLGFDYFQGYYFAKPVILSGKKLSPSQMVIVQLLNLINSDVDTVEIESAIKKDVSLCFNLLRIVNTPAIGARRRVESISQALMILGRNQLQRWLQIILYAEPGRKGFGAMPLLMLAATRGKLLELIAQQREPHNHAMAETAFTVGIMSLMDTLFSMPLEAILEQIPVADPVSQALLHRQGVYGDMLRLAEHTERLETGELLQMDLLEKNQLSVADLRDLQMEAFTWADSVTHEAC